MPLVFVYGTLKRGGKNHSQLAGQRFVGPAQTAGKFRLYDLGDYPGMVADPATGESIAGDLWRVDAACLRRLDAFEGVHEGHYHRESVSLEPPFADADVEAYIYARDLPGRQASI